MNKLLDLGGSPILGRVRGLNRKHRLRSKYWDSIDDWADTISIDVLDPARLQTSDHFPCQDEVFIVSDRLRKVIESVTDDAHFKPVQADDLWLWIVLPLTDNDVMYACDGSASYSRSGYNVVNARNVSAENQPSAAFAPVRNTRLLALSDSLVAAANTTEISWNPVESIDAYTAYRSHPYVVVGTGGNAAVADDFEPDGAWPDVPDTPHPLGENARDAEFDDDPNTAWNALIRSDYADDAALTRYCSGLALPPFRARLDDECAQSKLKTRWKETMAAGCVDMGGLPVISSAVRDRLQSVGVDADYVPVMLEDTQTGGERDDFWIIQPRQSMPWIDWNRSDVGLTWAGMPDSYLDLHPTDASYESSLPLVRIAGSNLILAHESLVHLFLDEEGFYLTPLHERFVARNLDDSIKAK